MIATDEAVSSNYNLTVAQGSTFTLPLTFNDAAGAPIDVSTWTFSGSIRTNYSAVMALAVFVFAAGISSNQVIGTISAANTSLIPVDPATSFSIDPTLYCYDIQASIPGGVVMRVLFGTVTVSPEVTH